MGILAWMWRGMLLVGVLCLQLDCTTCTRRACLDCPYTRTTYSQYPVADWYPPYVSQNTTNKPSRRSYSEP